MFLLGSDNAAVQETSSTIGSNTRPQPTGSGRKSNGQVSYDLKCDNCNAIFDTLDNLMDHRNFICGASRPRK